jgi:DNA-binding NtrC family response regulator
MDTWIAESWMEKYIPPERGSRALNCFFSAGGPMRTSGERDGGKVLIVSDDAFLKDILCSSLGEEGFRTIFSANTVEALESVLGDSYRATLFDLDMLRKDTWILARRVKEKSDGTRVIIFTEHIGQGLAESVRYSSVDLALHLPPRPLDIGRVIRRILDQDNGGRRRKGLRFLTGPQQGNSRDRRMVLDLNRNIREERRTAFRENSRVLCCQ